MLAFVWRSTNIKQESVSFKVDKCWINCTSFGDTSFNVAE